MADIVQPSILPGFMELLPEDQKSFDRLKNIIEDNFINYGFVNLDTPLIEKEEILLSKGGGETSKQIYRIDKESTPQALRFDLTVSLARFVAMNSHNLAFPFRRYQIGKVYRGERNQKGRYREFYQCDIDIVGQDKLSLYNDAEILLVIYKIFSEIGFNQLAFHVNNRRLLNGYFDALGIGDKEGVLRTVDKLQKIGHDKTVAELDKLGLDETQIEKIFYLISDKNEDSITKLNSIEIDHEEFQTGRKELLDVYQFMKDFGIPEDKIKIDFSITRGLDYYTGTVFETFLNGYESIGSVCSGGRYDDLANNFTKSHHPGIGASIGLSRLYYQLKEAGLLEETKQGYVDVIAIPMGDEDINYCYSLVEELRKDSIISQVYFENAKLKKKFYYADKVDAKYAIVVGENERNEGKVSLRNLKTGQQELIDKKEIINMIKR